MTIKKYQGKTKEEAIQLAKAELGADAEVMNIEEKKSGGFLGMGKKVIYEITAMVDRDIDLAALEQAKSEPVNTPVVDDNLSANSAIATYSNKSNSKFDAVADDEITIPRDYEKQSGDGDADLEETKRQFAELSKIFRENENSKTETTINAGQYSNPRMINQPSEVNRGEDNYERDNSNYQKSSQVPTQSSRVEEPTITNKTSDKNTRNSSNHKFIKTLYNTLLDNDVDEKYINQLLFDMEKVLKNGNNVNYLISNVYQKMILKMGQPSTISLAKKGPKVVFFIGSTGVGKTTTIAKIASDFKVQQKKEVALITIDTYRLKAADQLGEYASIMKIPMSVIYEPSELSDKVEKLSNYDLILVDTSGFSHKNNEMRENVVELINGLDDKFAKEVYLVLSATTKYSDLKEIIDSYKEFTDFKMIFTKLDETTNLGNILNCRLYSGSSLSYVTYGQNVPYDISEVDTQKLVKQLLGGN